MKGHQHTRLTDGYEKHRKSVVLVTIALKIHNSPAYSVSLEHDGIFRFEAEPRGHRQPTLFENHSQIQLHGLLRDECLCRASFLPTYSNTQLTRNCDERLHRGVIVTLIRSKISEPWTHEHSSAPTTSEKQFRSENAWTMYNSACTVILNIRAFHEFCSIVLTH